MADLEHNFALPLWSLVDQAKVEAGKSDMRGLAKELGKWLAHNFDVDHKGVAIEEPSGTEPGAMPMFVVAGVRQDHGERGLPAPAAERAEAGVIRPRTP
jgi:hypothetical protein